jgi:signal transduction histidine kinase
MHPAAPVPGYPPVGTAQAWPARPSLARLRLRLKHPARPLHSAAAAILAFALGSMLLTWTGYLRQVERVTVQSQLRASGAAGDVDRYVQGRWSTLYALATSPAMHSGEAAALGELFGQIDPGLYGFDAGISWVDRDGRVQAISGSGTGPAVDVGDREHVRVALTTRRPAVSSALVDHLGGEPVVGFAVPALDADGDLDGVLAGGIRLGSLGVGAENLHHASGSGMMLIDAAGQVLVAAEPVREIRSTDPAFPLAELAARGQGASRVDVGPDGSRDVLVGYATAPTSGWRVLVARPADEAFQATASYNSVGAAILAGAGLSVALLIWAARRLDLAFREQSAAYEAEREARELLQTAVGTLEQREALREAYVGVMSHELRTPVTTIYGAAKLLVRSPRRAEADSLLLDIEEEADRLRRITEDLLVLSRAEHGLLDIPAEPVLLQRLVPEAMAQIQRRYPHASIRADIRPGLPPVTGDAGALRQVLDNLLVNAVKYGEGAEILVHARDEGDAVRLCVEDDGPGLPEGDLEHVFDLFYRSPHNSATASGTGIGLYVARRLAEAMGGRLLGHSVHPRGVGFALSLPQYATEPEADAETQSPSGSQPRADVAMA